VGKPQIDILPRRYETWTFTDADLPEGEGVYLQPVDADEIDDEQRARLHEALRESIEQMRSGEILAAAEGCRSTGVPRRQSRVRGYDRREMACDTTDAARDAQIAAARRMSPSQKGQMAAEMSEEARRIAIEGERRRHPELTEAEARQIVLRRIWGPELAARVPLVGQRSR